MEKLIQILILFIFSQSLVAQESLVVFSLNGNHYIESNGIRKLAKKGDIITKKDRTIISSAGHIVAIDQEGNSYKINRQGKIAFSKLLNYRQKTSGTAITDQYFKLVWNELTEKSTKEKIIGGVFRGEVLMVMPPDSSKVLETKVTLKWTPEEGKTAFIFIRNKTTEEVLKLQTDGSQITIFADNPILNDGNEYEWTVSTSEFPNLKNIPFYSFFLIDKNTYNQQISANSDFISDMQQLEMSLSEIELAICKLYRVCK